MNDDDIWVDEYDRANRDPDILKKAIAAATPDERLALMNLLRGRQDDTAGNMLRSIILRMARIEADAAVARARIERSKRDA